MLITAATALAAGFAVLGAMVAGPKMAERQGVRPPVRPEQAAPNAADKEAEAKPAEERSEAAGKDEGAAPSSSGETKPEPPSAPPYVFESNWWKAPRTYGMFNYWGDTDYARLEAVRATVNGYRLLYNLSDYDYEKDAASAHGKRIKYIIGMPFKVKKGGADPGGDAASICLPYREIEADAARKAEKTIDFGADGLAAVQPFGDDVFMDRGVSCLCPDNSAGDLSRENQLNCAVEFYRQFALNAKKHAKEKGEENFPVAPATHGEWLIPLTIDMLPFSDFAFANLNFEHYVHSFLYKLHSAAVKRGGGLIAAPTDASFGWLVEKAGKPNDLIKIKMAEAYANKGAFNDQHQAGLSPECIGREPFAEKCWLDASADAGAVREINSFYLANKELFGGAFKSAANIAVLFSARSVKSNLSEHWALFNAISRTLAESGFQYDVIFSENSRFSPNTLTLERLRKYGLVVLPGNGVMDAAAVSALSAYALSGGGIIAANPIDSRIGSSEDFSSRAEYLDYRGDPASARELVSLLDGKTDKIVSGAPAKIGVQMWRDDNKTIIHLVNYDFDLDKGAIARKNIPLSIRIPGGGKPSGIKMISPDFEGARNLEFDYSGGKIRLTVPELKIWDVLVIE